MEESYFRTYYNEHGEKVLNEIFSWFVNKTLPDVVLHVEDQLIEAHKLILGASSTFFKSIFSTRESKHMYFEDISYRTMKAIVEYMYTGQLAVEWQLMPECLKMADCLMIRGLSKLYCDKVVKEPAPVSQEMLDAIEAISKAKPCIVPQSKENTQESLRKHLNPPKLQLKRDAKTGNWITKHDDLHIHENGHIRMKSTTKHKLTAIDSRKTKLAKTNICEQITNESPNLSPQQTPFSHCDAGCMEQLANPMLDQVQESSMNINSSTLYLADNKQDFVLASQESLSNASAKTEPEECATTDQPTKNKHVSFALTTPLPSDYNQMQKKQTPDLNSKAVSSQKNQHIKKEPTLGKEALDTDKRFRQQETLLKNREKRASIVRRNKRKQRTETTTTSTASKATELLIEKLFNEPKIKRSPTAKQHNSTKSPKQAAAAMSNAAHHMNNANNAPSPAKLSVVKLCQLKEEEQQENGTAIKTETNEISPVNAKQLHRLANRIKVSDWHIDESEVLECDEEYEQHKNEPCPQPAEFLKTEKLVYGCPSCTKAYTLKSNYRRHYVVAHRRQEMPVYKCPICDSRFTRTDNRNSHIRKIHDFADPLAVQSWNQPFFMCALCKKGFYNDQDLQNHLKTVHPPVKNTYFGRVP